jgi:heme o synthase
MPGPAASARAYGEPRMRTTAVTTVAGRSRAGDYAALAKPRLNLLVVASALAGYVMAGGDTSSVPALLWTLLGTGLVAGGASTFNQILERDRDALMRRTRLRPLPDGRLSVAEAAASGTVLTLAGLLMLAAGVNLLAAAVALATLVSYVAVYTPLKRRTSFATVIGAVPGALPPVIGWAAASNELSHGAWILFGIVFLWQMPHFLAIAWMYKEDYARAGYPMLPVIEPDGRSTGRQAAIYTAALVPLALAPTLVGMTGVIYFAGALLVTLVFLLAAVRFAMTREVADARRLFFTSLAYLSLVWFLMIADRA